MTATATAPARETAASPPDAAVSLRGAGKRFGDQWVLRDLDIEVPRGEIVGLIGPSGCGKTTTVRMINGTYRPDAGEVSTLGRAPWKLTRQQRQRLGYLPQQPVLFDSLSLWENLHFHASLNGVRFRRRARLQELLELVELSGHEKKLVKECSGGMQRRLAIAATLLHRPALVVLDEPTAGIDPILRARFWDHFRELAAGGTTLIVTTQYVAEAAHCDHVGLLADGGLLHYATPAGLRRAAVGGEQLVVTTSRPLTDDELAAAGRLPEVACTLERGERPAQMVGVVTDAGRAIPALLAWLGEHDIGVEDSEEVGVDYEEVFVLLVEQAAAADDDDGGADAVADGGHGLASDPRTETAPAAVVQT